MGSVVVVRKLLLRMKFCILVSYWCVGSMTVELLLSPLAIKALFFLSLFWIDLIIFFLWVSFVVGGFFWFSVSMRSATSFMYTSLSLVGSREMAVSASRARFGTQFFLFACTLYFRPFCNSVVSLLVKGMLVLLTTLG